MIKRIIRKLIDYLRWHQIVPDPFWRSSAKRNGLLTSDVKWDGAARGLRLKAYDLLLTAREEAFVLESLPALQSLKPLEGFRLHKTESGLLLCVNGQQFCVDNRQEVSIIKEVYADSIYNFDFFPSSLVLDIGFNVGTASLNFAANPNVKHVVGYEPLLPTCDKGTKNLSLNHELASKISLRKYGLGEKDSEIFVTYEASTRGNVSTKKPLRVGGKRLEKAIVKNCVVELRDILNSKLYDVSTDSLVAKIDCEGAENEILKSWASAKMLRRFAFLMLEYHYQEPAALIALLRAENFATITISQSRSLGMIYAYNRNESPTQ